MKKLRLLGLLTVLVFSFTLAGCGIDDDSETQELESKVEQLEQEITNLEKNNSQSASSDDSASSSGQTADQTSAQTSDDTLETLESAVNDVVTKADSAQASGSDQENQDQFFTLKDELKSVENRLDLFDDTIEAQYRQGTLSLEEYRSQEHSLETLEDQLDTAEDKLEYTFGIDD